MKLTSVFIASAAFLASLVSANPIHAEKELVARQHSATSASVTGFSVTRNTTHVIYSATIQINPSHPALLYTHATAGTAVPVNSGFWTVSDAALSFRFQRVPTTGTGNYRLILTDAHVPGPGTSVTLTYLSPTGDWAGAGTTVYTGVTSFTLL